MQLRNIVVFSYTASSLTAALPPSPPLIRSLSPLLLPRPTPALSGNANQDLTDWPAIDDIVPVLRTDLEFRVTIYGASRPPIPSSQDRTIAQELHDIEVQLRGSNSSSPDWYYDTEHLTILFSPPIFPTGNTITPSRAADLMQQLQFWTFDFGPREIADSLLMLTPYYCRFSMFYAHEYLTAWPEKYAFTRIPGRNFSFVVNNYGPTLIPAALNFSVANDISGVESQLARLNSTFVPFNTVYHSGSVYVEFIEYVTPPWLPVSISRAISLLGFLRNLTLAFGPREVEAGAIQTSAEQSISFILYIGRNPSYPPASDIR